MYVSANAGCLVGAFDGDFVGFTGVKSLLV